MKSFIFWLCIGGLSTPAWAKTSVAVVASKASSLGTVSVEQTRRIFLGETEFLPNGTRAAPVDQAKTAPITSGFYQTVAGMTLKDLSVHWAKKVFTGKGVPPARVNGGDAAVKAWLDAHPTGIGYVSEDSVDATVKVLLVLP